MFIFNKDGDVIVNSENVTCFRVDDNFGYCIMADKYYIESYLMQDDAIKELNNIFRQIEAGATSYQIR